MSASNATSGTAANLHEAAKQLSVQWQQTKAYWSDAKSRDFESRYLEHLPADVGRAITVMDELVAVLKKIRSDCE